MLRRLSTFLMPSASPSTVVTASKNLMSPPNKTQSTTTPKTYFEQLFRCPVCHGGENKDVHLLDFGKTTKATNNKNNTNNKVWMTGNEMDHHLHRDIYTHFRLRNDLLNRKLDRLSWRRSKRLNTISNNTESNSANNNNKSSKEQPEKSTTNHYHHHLTRNCLEKEIQNYLSALPNSSLVDRYLVIDACNIQINTHIGAMASIPEIDMCWRAFQKERVCVVFIHEGMLTHCAPIFNTFGALAEGSANVHDGNNNGNYAGNSRDHRNLPNWKTGRGSKDRLVPIANITNTPTTEKDINLFSDTNTKQHKQEEEKAENPFRPWNSVVIPTIRGVESGDFALFESILKLEEMIRNYEECYLDDVISTRQRERKKSTLAKIDLLSDDRELTEAVEAALQPSGRVITHGSWIGFASSILMEE